MALTDLSQVTTETIVQIVGSTQTVGSETPVIDRLDASGNIVECHGTTVPTAATAGYSKNAIFRKTDAGAGVTGLYTNTGTTSSCTFTLVDTALPGDTASSLIDTNSVTALDVGTTASAVNNLRVTNSATGAVSANAVTLSAVGSDSAVSLSIVPKGATGITTVGLSTGTGDVVVGSSSATQTVKISNGAGIANTNIAAVTTAGSTTNIASAATGNGVTDTVNIATGNSTGSGNKVVHIADGVPGGSGSNTVTMGSTLNNSTVSIVGGPNASSISIASPSTGIIAIGGGAQSGDIVVGSSSATQTVKLGNGAGASTINLANVSVAGANVNMATAATGAGITDTVSISTGNAAATGIKVVNILTGTPGTSGNNRLTMGGGTTSKVTLNAAVSSYQAINYIASETGSNNAIAGALTDAGGSNVTLAAGLRVLVKLGHTLQAGANTFNLNGGGAVNIKSHLNIANNIGTAYAATGVIDLFYDGTQWVDMSQ